MFAALVVKFPISTNHYILYLFSKDFFFCLYCKKNKMAALKLFLAHLKNFVVRVGKKYFWIFLRVSSV